jgi:amidohydrolase
MKLPEEAIERCIPEAIELRRMLHMEPELGYEEVRTGERVVEFIGEREGVEIRKGVGRTGIEVVIGRGLKGPCVALRADMDALPIDEQSGVEWASRTKGVMHACGHDGHTAMLAGAGRILSEHQDLLEGPVKLIFQPAEEGGGGGLAMCEDGILENPRVAAVYGLHNNLPGPELKVGSIAYTEGAAMAGTGVFTIEVIGKGGHAAFPHRCVDPLYIASVLISELQSLVSRRLNPLVPGVVSVTAIAGGNTHNVIPERVRLQGTFRALDAAVLRDMNRWICELAHSVSESHGGRAEVVSELGYPVLVNSGSAMAIFEEIVEYFGEGDRLEKVAPNLGGEDFAYYAQRVPSFFYYLPACPADCDDTPACHHPAFDFNDDLVGLGIRLHVATALGFARFWKG